MTLIEDFAWEKSKESKLMLLIFNFQSHCDDASFSHFEYEERTMPKQIENEHNDV